MEFGQRRGYVDVPIDDDTRGESVLSETATSLVPEPVEAP